MRSSFLPLLTVLSRLLYGEAAAQVTMVLTDYGSPVPSLTSYAVRTSGGSPLKASNAPDHPLIKELLQDALFLGANTARVSVLTPPHFVLLDQIQEPEILVDLRDVTGAQEITFDARLHFLRMSDLELATFIHTRPSGDHVADQIALDLQDELPAVHQFFLHMPAHQANGDDNGFEVQYAMKDVIAYALCTRPHLLEAVTQAWIRPERPLPAELSAVPPVPQFPVAQRVDLTLYTAAPVDLAVLRATAEALGGTVTVLQQKRVQLRPGHPDTAMVVGALQPSQVANAI